MIVFLDIDGVLNSSRSLRRFNTHKRFDPECVAALNRITDMTDARIVVSSSWRWGRTLDMLRQELRNQGVTGEVLGMTPKIDADHREREIQAWMSYESAGPVTYVILDDTNIPGMEDRLVRTDMAVGLTQEDAGKAIDMLKGTTW